MGFVDFDVCPKCGCDLVEAEIEKEKQEIREKHPEDCHCSWEAGFSRDINKDEYIEHKMIKSSWPFPHPDNPSHAYAIYKCHRCGKRYVDAPAMA
jgi:hypothetical protein